MALTRLYQFDTGTVLAEADLEGEFDQIYGSSLSLVSPWAGNMAAGGNLLTGLSLGAVSGPSLQFTGDTNTGIYSSAADTVDVATGGVRAASFGASFLLNAAPEDARTNSVDVAGEVRSTTSGVPAAGIGVGLLFSAESGDENPSEFGRLDFAASDIGAGTEDTYASVLLRVAGRALDEKYRFSSTAGSGFAALFTHAVTADRTYTLPDADTTLGAGQIKGWINMNYVGGVPTLVDQYNAVSLSDDGTGLFTITWNVDFSGTTYAAQTTNKSVNRLSYVGTKAAGTTQIQVTDTGGAGNDADVDVAAMGAQ